MRAVLRRAVVHAVAVVFGCPASSLSPEPLLSPLQRVSTRACPVLLECALCPCSTVVITPVPCVYTVWLGRPQVLLRSAPVSFGMPLVAILFEQGVAGVVANPSPALCRTRDLCNGLRFYSVCFNGGTNRIYCDRSIESAWG